MPESTTLAKAPSGGRASWWLVLVPAAVLLLLWLPFGFSMIGLIEEWDLLSLFAEHGLFFYVHLDGPLALHALRPLMPFSFALAHALSPDSFAGWHVLTIAALLVKGASMGWLGWRASGRCSVGVVGAVLLILYPADTMQLSFRSLHINLAGALSLMAAVLAVHAMDTPRRVVMHGCAIAAGLILLFGGLMYEAAFTLAAMPLAVLWVRHGASSLRWLRERWTVVASWMAAPVAYGLYAIWIGSYIPTYQNSVMAQGSGLQHALSVWLDLFRIGAARALVGGWIDAAAIAASTFRHYGYLAGATFALVVLCALGSRQAQSRGAVLVDHAESPLPMGLLVRMFIAGLAMLLMGYAPFMVSMFHMAISQRTYLWAAPGAVFAWLAILMLLARAGRPMAVVAAVTLMTLGLAAQLFQFHHYVSLSDRQRTLLRAVVDNFDEKPSARKTVVLDGTSQMGHDWMFIDNAGLQRALTYLFGHAVATPEICRVPSLEWVQRDALGRPGLCVTDGRSWTFNYPAPVDGPGHPAGEPKAPVRLDARDVALLRILEDGQAESRPETAAHRQALAAGDSVIARRYRGVLAPPVPGPVPAMFEDQYPQARWRFSFGDWWSLEEVPYGAGWRPSEWSGRWFAHRSAAWKVSPEASLYFHLRPVSGAYLLRGVFTDFASDEIRTTLRARINGTDVDLKWTGALRFEAAVPQGILTAGRNELMLIAPVEPTFHGLSARLDWVALDPQGEK